MSLLSFLIRCYCTMVLYINFHLFFTELIYLLSKLNFKTKKDYLNYKNCLNQRREHYFLHFHTLDSFQQELVQEVFLLTLGTHKKEHLSLKRSRFFFILLNEKRTLD